MVGYVILLTGISGSGKTTIAKALKDYLREKSTQPLEFIDGDTYRDFLEISSGHTTQERSLVTKQIAYAAHLLAKHGVNVIVANISGTYEVRDFLRRKWDKYIQIFLDVDIKDCIDNDPKGVYKKALKLNNPLLCGYDIPYEKPRKPDVTVYPYKETIGESLAKIVFFLTKINMVS